MPDSTQAPLPIVVGVDGSQAAIQAAEWAIDEAVSREVPLRLVAVIRQQAEPAPRDAVGNILSSGTRSAPC
jgi:nucleotide-binding universal stress UspA family protein